MDDESILEIIINALRFFIKYLQNVFPMNMVYFLLLNKKKKTTKNNYFLCRYEKGSSISILSLQKKKKQILQIFNNVMMLN